MKFGLQKPQIQIHGAKIPVSTLAKGSRNCKRMRARGIFDQHTLAGWARRPHRAQKFAAAPREFGWSLNGIDSRLRPGKTCSLALYLITSTISFHYGEREKRGSLPPIRPQNEPYPERRLIRFFLKIKCALNTHAHTTHLLIRPRVIREL